MNHTDWSKESHDRKERFATPCHPLRASRLKCAVLRASLEPRLPLGEQGLVGSAILKLPVYALVRVPGGGRRMIRQPPIAGGSGKALLHCWIEALPGAVVVHAEGEVDLSTAAWLEESISDAFRQGPSVIVDLAGVSYLDGSGIRVLKRVAESHLAHLAVAASRPQVQRLLDIVRLSDDVPVLASLKAGQEYLRHCG